MDFDTCLHFPKIKWIASMSKVLLNIIHTEAPLHDWYAGRNLLHSQDIIFIANENWFLHSISDPSLLG